MNRTLFTGAALAVALAAATPMLAWSASDNDPAASSSSEVAQAPQGPPGGPGMMGHGGREHAMGGGGGWMHRMMLRRMMAQLSPRQRCEERLARRAGLVAYTAAKLNLTAQQKPLWDKLDGQLQANAGRERQICQSLPATKGTQTTILDRVDRREQFMTARLEGLRQIKPALQQFYQALTAQQKAIVDHPFHKL